jgi:hypothetical protein
MPAVTATYRGDALDNQDVVVRSRPRHWYEEGLGAGRHELTIPGGSRPVIPIARLRELIKEWSSGPDDGWNREFISEYVRGLRDALKEAEEEE